MKSALIHLTEDSVITLSKVKSISLMNKEIVNNRNAEIDTALKMLNLFIDKLDNEDFEQITGLKKL